MSQSRPASAALFAEELKRGKFVQEFLGTLAVLGHKSRTKVQPSWIGSTLRLQARNHRLELRPASDGVMAHFFVNDSETGHEKVDLRKSSETLAKKWMEKVGPRPPEPGAATE